MEEGGGALTGGPWIEVSWRQKIGSNASSPEEVISAALHRLSARTPALPSTPVPAVPAPATGAPN